MHATVTAAAVLAAAVCAAACVPPASLSGPPARETAWWTSRDEVKNVIVQQMVDDGYTVKATTDFSLTFEKPASGLMNALYSSEWNHQAVYRVVFNVVPGGADTVHITGAVAVVTNPGSGFEQAQDVSGREGGKIASFLVCVKFVAMRQFERSSKCGPDGEQQTVWKQSKTGAAGPKPRAAW